MKSKHILCTYSTAWSTRFFQRLLVTIRVHEAEIVYCNNMATLAYIKDPKKIMVRPSSLAYDIIVSGENRLAHRINHEHTSGKVICYGTRFKNFKSLWHPRRWQVSNVILLAGPLHESETRPTWGSSGLNLSVTSHLDPPSRNDLLERHSSTRGSMTSCHFPL